MKTFVEEFGDDGQYEASLEIEPGETQGWVLDRKTRNSASLAALEATGVLTGDGADQPVDKDDIEAIMAWAEENGY